jgi:hypothetical protein
MRGAGLLLAAAFVLGSGLAAAQETALLCDFEDDAALQQWEMVHGAPALVAQGATHGARALQVTFDTGAPYYGAYLLWRNVPRDWSKYDALVLDVLNPNASPVPGYVLIADAAWQEKGRSYWNRHNGQAAFAPGHTSWVIPVQGLYRGEAGSRNNDIKRNIDPDSIVRLDFGFGEKGATGRIVIDNLRFVKVGRPAGVWAFDFGPASQSVMLGWTPVSHETRYAAERGFGWGPQGGAPWAGADRDTTFGPALLRDFCEAGGYNFRVDVPPGRYRATLFYENSGYWGGEQAMQTERRILANGQIVWHEERPDGPAHMLYRFEDVEPVGVDLWDTYMKPELARPAEFEAEAGNEGLTLRFEADRVWGSKVAGMVLYRAGDIEAEAWMRVQMDTLAAEFRQSAVCLDGPAPAFEAAEAWRKAGLVAWAVQVEDTVTPNSVPPPGPAEPDALALSRLAVRGEHEPFCLAVRPLRDLGECSLVLDGLAGAGLESAVQVVHYNTSRGFNSIAYHVMPHTLRGQTKVALPRDVTRELVVTVRVGSDAPPGEHEGELRLVNAQGEAVLRVPLRLTVRPVSLDRSTEFHMGFFGLEPPGMLPEGRQRQALQQTLAMLREHGMNAVSGGPNFALKGWQNGQPAVDFGEMDAFFGLLREHGFTGPLNGYGGARFVALHDGYEKGETGAKVEEQSGLPYEEALMRAWREVDAHARRAQWPTILYAMCDETRVRENAERELAFMHMMQKVSAAFPQTVRTSGSYSVTFEQRPTDPEDMLYWHQRFFDALDVSSLNGHDQSVMDEARNLGKEVQVYNQGVTRYSFGLYQWSEYRKGVRARWQWHLNILHGYQFFDLDGREPDTAMICYGRDSLYPTIQFERCREGAEDFYLYQTLWHMVEAKRAAGEKSAALDAAAALLEGAVAKVGLGQGEPPAGFDADALKAQVVAAIESLQGR